MSPPKKLQNITECQKMHFVCGLTKEESNITKQKEDIEDTYSKNQMKYTREQKNQMEKASSTLEFHLENNRVTLRDKQNIYPKNTQTIQSSLISDQELTLKEKDSNGFWKKYSKEISEKLWLPTKTALADLDINCLNGFSNNTVQRSFVIKKPQIIKQKNYQMTSWLSSLCSQPDTMEEENIKQLAYCRKIRFYPTTEHKVLLEKCFGATRYLTNKALHCIKKGDFCATSNAISMRNNLRYQDKYLEEKEMWLKEVPYDTRDAAIRQLSSNFKTVFTQLKNKTIKFFSMRFKSKRNLTQVCFVNKNAFKNEVGKKKLFGGRVKKSFTFKENIDDFVHGTITIAREKNRYYMCFPMKREQLNINTKYKAVALDPGVRTFQTFYSEEGLCGKIGDQESLRLKRILELEDKLKSKLSTLKDVRKSTRYNLRKRCFFLRTKVKNIVTDLHRKTCHWLTTTFKHVFLPSFDVRHMVKKSKRNIGKSTVRAMLSLSHYSFKERLLHMATYRGCKVHICSEAYTSKTCGCCGNMNNTLGGNKVFDCSNCGISIDRDYNGARNSYLRNTQSHG